MNAANSMGSPGRRIGKSKLDFAFLRAKLVGSLWAQSFVEFIHERARGRNADIPKASENRLRNLVELKVWPGALEFVGSPNFRN